MKMSTESIFFSEMLEDDHSLPLMFPIRPLQAGSFRALGTQ